MRSTGHGTEVSRPHDQESSWYATAIGAAELPAGSVVSATKFGAAHQRAFTLEMREDRPRPNQPYR